MNCAQYEKYLSSYIDNELTGLIPAAALVAWTAELELHLKTCTACQEVYQSLLKTKQQLAALPDVPLAPELERQLTAFFSSAPAVSSGVPPVVRPDLKQLWLDFRVFIQRMITPPRLAASGGVLAIVFLWLGVNFFAAKPITIPPKVTQDIALEELMQKHMESVYETTNPVQQRGVIIMYNRKMQNTEVGQAVDYEK